MLDRTVAEGLLRAAYAEAEQGLDEGGVPIGAVLARMDGEIVARGRNRYAQDGDPITHAETAAVRNGGLIEDYRELVLATTMAPCWMCSGMVRFLGIRTVVVGDTTTWDDGALDWVRERGIDVVVLAEPDCAGLFARWSAEHAAHWERVQDAAGARSTGVPGPDGPEGSEGSDGPALG